jgi:hypothetical protein
MPTTKQIIDARNAVAFNTFVARMGEIYGPYACDANRELIVSRVLETWGTDAASSPDAHEIAFKQLLAEGALTKNENFVPPSLRAEIENLSGAETSRRYRRDPMFRKAFDIVASEEATCGAVPPQN